MKEFLNLRACKLIASNIIRKHAWKEIPFQKENKSQTHLTSKLFSPEVWQNPCGTIGQTQSGAAFFYQASWHLFAQDKPVLPWHVLCSQQRPGGLIW